VGWCVSVWMRTHPDLSWLNEVRLARWQRHQCVTCSCRAGPSGPTLAVGPRSTHLGSRGRRKERTGDWQRLRGAATLIGINCVAQVSRRTNVQTASPARPNHIASAHLIRSRPNRRTRPRADRPLDVASAAIKPSRQRQATAWPKQHWRWFRRSPAPYRSPPCPYRRSGETPRPGHRGASYRRCTDPKSRTPSVLGSKASRG